MSETFSQPSSPTEGLQPYVIERGVKNLYPATKARLASRNQRRRRFMNKDNSMIDTIDKMVATLAKSVSGINAAAPDDRDALIEKSFSEFKAALLPELEKGVSEAVEFAKVEAGFEEPLHKGLGCVGRIANLLGSMASQIKAIKDGQDSWMNGSTNAPEPDPCSDDVSEILDHAVAMAEIALRECVNEHVDLADEDDSPDNVEKGVSLVIVPSAENPDDENAAFLVKTTLPAELAKMATDPGALGIMTMEHATAMMLRAGIPEERMAKLLSNDMAPLNKSAGAVDDQGNPIDGGSPDGSADPTMDDGSQDGGQDDPLDVLGRLLAASMIQLDHIQQMVAGSDQDQGDIQPADTAAADPEGNAGSSGHADGTVPKDPNDEPNPKPPVAKGVDLSEDPELVRLRLEKAELVDMLNKVMAQPETPKGALRAGGVLEKSADSALSGDSALEKFAKELDACTTPEARSLLLTKAAYKFPGVDLKALSKLG